MTLFTPPRNRADQAALEAERINAHIAKGRSVHFQTSAICAWRRIVSATAEGGMIRFQFDGGGEAACLPWLDAVDCGDAYTIGWNLSPRELGRFV